MNFVEGNYIEKDVRRLKKITSLLEDVKSHYLIFKGCLDEKINNKYDVPLVSALLYETVLSGGIEVLFYKDRCATKNPRMTPREGLRIVFALYVKDKVPIQYMPFIIFTAKEEKDRYICPDGKQYPLTSSSFKKIIESKLEYYTES